MIEIKAFYPDHPDKRVIKKNDFYKNDLSEKDIWNYLDKVKNLIIPEIKGRYLLLRLLTEDGRDVVIRHDRKTGKFYKIDNVKEYDKLNNGRVVAFYPEAKSSDNIVRVDLDPNKHFKFDEVKDVTLKIIDILERNKFIKKVKVKFSGNRGFHIVAEFKDNVSTKDLREEIEQFKKEINIKEVPSL